MNDQTEQKRKELARRVLDRIASDPQFREQLVENPQQALETSGFAQEIRDWQGVGDVSGYQLGPSGPPQTGPFDTIFGLGIGAPPSPGPGLIGPPIEDKEPSPGILPGKDPDPRIDPPIP